MDWKRTLAGFLPGIFLIGFNIGTGSVTTMAKSGATYGMSLLWALCLSVIVTFYMINFYGRFTIITGETALQAFRKHIHPLVGIFFIVALTFNVTGSVMGVMGIVAEVSHEWSRTWIEGGISSLSFALFYSSLVYGLFMLGSTRSFQNALSVLVALMGICFVANFFIMTPPLAEIGKGLIPSIPVETTGSFKGAFLVIASMVGTTVFSGLFIIRTTLVKEAGWTLTELPQQKRDALVSVAMMFILSAAIMAAAAGTLHAQGLGLDSVSQMITLLEPMAGTLAVSIFAIGIIAAGVSSQFPNVLMLPWLLCDYFETSRDMRRIGFRIMVLVISTFGLVVPIFNARPIIIMIASQAFGALIFPVTVACIFYLSNNRKLMKEHTLGLYENAILGLIFCFSLFMSFLGFQGLIELVSKSF